MEDTTFKKVKVSWVGGGLSVRVAPSSIPYSRVLDLTIEEAEELQLALGIFLPSLKEDRT